MKQCVGLGRTGRVLSGSPTDMKWVVEESDLKGVPRSGPHRSSLVALIDPFAALVAEINILQEMLE